MATSIETNITSGVDLSGQVPDVKILPGERVVDVRHLPIQPHTRHISAIDRMKHLTGVRHAGEIGTNGPSVAAAVTETNKALSELRRYEVFFPRDAHVVAELLDDSYPRLAETTVLQSLKYMGVRENLHSTGPKDLQEFGKVPHEIRDPLTDQSAQALTVEKDWGWPYYGAIDTTGKNAKAIAKIALRPGNLAWLETTYEGLDGEEHTVEHALQSHMNWMRRRMSLNKEGLIEALWVNPKHHANESWTDSPDAFHHADGSWAVHHPEKNWGVAPLEVQAEAFTAIQRTAELYSALAATSEGAKQKYYEEEVRDLTARAENLRAVIVERFWVEDSNRNGGFFARGTDRDENGNLRPLAVRSSAMGHLLFSGVLDGDDPEIVRKREAVVRNLLSPEMLCPSGLRTLASDEVRYRDESYHNGKSWPFDTKIAGLGLERYGYYGLAQKLDGRIMSLYNETKILPENAKGSLDPRDRLSTRKVKVYDPTLPGESLGQQVFSVVSISQEAQAWTVAAVLAIKKRQSDRISPWRYEPGDPVPYPKVLPPTRAVGEKEQELEEALLGSL